jgi:hypothetical protein
MAKANGSCNPFKSLRLEFERDPDTLTQKLMPVFPQWAKTFDPTVWMQRIVSKLAEEALKRKDLNGQERQRILDSLENFQRQKEAILEEKLKILERILKAKPKLNREDLLKEVNTKLKATKCPYTGEYYRPIDERTLRRWLAMIKDRA